MNDIVVGIDRSDTGLRAAERAAEKAAALGVNLHPVMTIERSGSSEFVIGSDTFRIDPLAEAEHFLVETTRSLDDDAITHEVPYGDPAKALCAEAERIGAGMIVVGNRRTQGLTRVLGSVASGVVKSAPCDVLIAHTTASS